jgi:glycosyltransferase involved in cell wall biosynthesis
LKICFYAASSIPVHARSLEERPLGGTETGLIRVSESLARRGHQVFVVTAHENPLPFNVQGGPIFIPEGALRQVVPFDVLVAVQHWRALFLGIPARRNVFWTGDGYEQFSNFGVGDKRVIEKIEVLLAASQWHAASLSMHSLFPLEKIRVVGNGFHPPYFEGKEPRARRRIIYTSAPYRGLELAAKYFELLKPQFPDAEFHVFSGLSIYDRDQSFSGPLAEDYRRLSAKLSRQPGVVLHGNVLQSQLAREYLKSSVLLYPNIIEETFCITAIEAQAAGCPVIASAISALPETVGDGGFVIKGDIGGEEYSRELIHALGTLLTDDEAWLKCATAAKVRAYSHFTWDHVALRIEEAVSL